MWLIKFEHVVWFMFIRIFGSRQIRVVWRTSFVLVGVNTVHSFLAFFGRFKFWLVLSWRFSTVWLSWFVGRWTKRPEFSFDLASNASCLSKTRAAPNAKRPCHRWIAPEKLPKKGQKGAKDYEKGEHVQGVVLKTHGLLREFNAYYLHKTENWEPDGASDHCDRYTVTYYVSRAVTSAEKASQVNLDKMKHELAVAGEIRAS